MNISDYIRWQENPTTERLIEIWGEQGFTFMFEANECSCSHPEYGTVKHPYIKGHYLYQENNLINLMASELQDGSAKRLAKVLAALA